MCAFFIKSPLWRNPRKISVSPTWRNHRWPGSGCRRSQTLCQCVRSSDTADAFDESLLFMRHWSAVKSFGRAKNGKLSRHSFSYQKRPSDWLAGRKPQKNSRGWFKWIQIDSFEGWQQPHCYNIPQKENRKKTKGPAPPENATPLSSCQRRIDDASRRSSKDLEVKSSSTFLGGTFHHLPPYSLLYLRFLGCSPG